MKSSRMAWKATLQASQSSSKFFGLILLHSSPDMLNWRFIWKSQFSAIQPSVRLWALSYATRFLSCLLFSAGFWAAIRPWRPLRARIWRTVLGETGVAGVHSSWHGSGFWQSDQQAVVSSSCLARSAQPGSVMDVASLLVALTNPLHLPFRHIEDVCNFSRRLGLESLDQHFGFWLDFGHVDKQCWALTDD